MKKYIIYTVTLVAGLFLGWILFGNSSDSESDHPHIETTQTNQMWTCSMHPQIMQAESGDCPICGMDLIPVEAGEVELEEDQFKLSQNAMALANIQTSVVSSDKPENNAIKLSGKIVENETSKTVQVSYFSGRIESLHVRFTGEEIRKGQLLANIYSPELYAAQQELLTATSLKESQPDLYKAVRNKLKLWKLSESQINKMETSGIALENFPVFATVTGTVTEKLVEQGDFVKQGQPLLKIANLNTVWANFDVFENQIDLFKEGQELLITTNAYPNREFKGNVSFIDPVLDTRTRTIKLRVELDNRDKVFKPGMFVESKMDGVSTGKGQIPSIPSTAVLWTGERSVVYVKTSQDEPVFEMREVKLGNTQGENYKVLSGLKEGEEIVTNGTFTVDAAAQIQGKRSMMNKERNITISDREGNLDMKNKSDIDNHSNGNNRLEVPKAFQQQLKKVFESYINVKDALVQGDTKKVTVEANNLLNNLSLIDAKLTKEEANEHWMYLEKEINKYAMSIAKTSNIKEQRDYFRHLSSHIIQAVQSFGVNQKVYVEFCPMANNNNGAYWLSKEDIILNPYFGDVMLNCGEVKQIIE